LVSLFSPFCSQPLTNSLLHCLVCIQFHALCSPCVTGLRNTISAVSFFRCVISTLYSLHSGLLLTKAHRALVKTTALHRE
jgi:hypothetical protein